MEDRPVDTDKLASDVKKNNERQVIQMRESAERKFNRLMHDPLVRKVTVWKARDNKIMKITATY